MSARHWKAVTGFETTHSIFFERGIMKFVSTPEDVFLEVNPAFSPINLVDMIDCVVTRTHSLMRCLAIALKTPEEMPKETIADVMWQIGGNLEQIKKLTAIWDGVKEGYQDGLPLGLDICREPPIC